MYISFELGVVWPWRVDADVGFAGLRTLGCELEG